MGASGRARGVGAVHDPCACAGLGEQEEPEHAYRRAAAAGLGALASIGGGVVALGFALFAAGGWTARQVCLEVAGGSEAACPPGVPLLPTISFTGYPMPGRATMATFGALAAVLAAAYYWGLHRLAHADARAVLASPSFAGTEHGRLRRRARHGGRLAAAALACGLVACPLFAATCGYSMYYDVRVHELIAGAFFVALVVHVYLHALARAVLPGLRGPTWARWARALAPGGIALVGVALAASFALEPDLAKVRRLCVSLIANLTKADRRGPGAIRRCVPRIVKCSDSRTGSRRCSGRPSLSWALSTSPAFSSSSRPPGRKGGSGRGPTPGSVERVRGEFTAAPPVHAASSDNESSSLHGPRKCHDSPSASAPVQDMVPPPSSASF